MWKLTSMHWIGFSTEVMPIDDQVIIGAKFYEADTYLLYIFNASRTWSVYYKVVKLAAGTTVGLDTGSNVIGAVKLVDELGVPYGVKHIDNKPRVSCMRYTYDVVKGNIPFAAPWSKIGNNGDVDATEEDIWPVGGVYVDPTAEMGMEIYSSSDDDKAGGTGVTAIIVHYLTNTFVKKTEIKATNGTTAVALTATDIYRVNHFRAYTCGISGAAVGNIDLRHLTDTPIYARLEPGYVRARQAKWTVPKDTVLFINNIGGSVTNPGGGRSGTFSTKATYDNLRNEKLDFYMVYHQKGLQDGEFNKDLDPPTRFIEGVDLKVSFKGDAGNADAIVHWEMRGWLEPA